MTSSAPQRSGSIIMPGEEPKSPSPVPLSAPPFPPAQEDDERGLTREEKSLKGEPTFLEKLKARGRAQQTQAAVAIVEVVLGDLTVEFGVRPLTEKEFDAQRKLTTKEIRDKRTNWQPVIDSYSIPEYHSLVIYEATVAADRAKLWDNAELREAYGAMSAADLIDKILLAGGKSHAIDVIERISGYTNDLESQVRDS